MHRFFFSLMSLVVMAAHGQTAFDYRVELEPLTIPALTGLHSYAAAEHDGKWLFVGGRRDGLHARQPFNAFPENQNNDMLRVIDPQTAQWWEAGISTLPQSLQEQLQSTNMCFTQHGDSLYLIGGYAYSSTAADHITFPRLTVLHVQEVISAVMSGNVDASSFRVLDDERMAVTGGRLAHDETGFLLVGGHRFDGNYNPMGMPTYTQSYTNAIRRFQVVQQASGLNLSNFTEQIDQVHLHRRDYNLLPWRYADGHESYFISSGVFQPTVDLPFLYPVELDGAEVIPHTAFNQYLSNYHCPSLSVFDGSQTHALFFGGMSRYYYSNGVLVEDDLVPFTRTISRITRTVEGNFEEGVFATQMPGLRGSGAEFLVDSSLPSSASGVVLLNEIPGDTIELGYIYGGISSTQLNPFSSNQTSSTSADASIYRVRLVRETLGNHELSIGYHDRSIGIFPNPAHDVMHIRTASPFEHGAFHIVDAQGKLLEHGELTQDARSEVGCLIPVKNEWSGQSLNVVVVFDHKYTAVQTVYIR